MSSAKIVSTPATLAHGDLHQDVVDAIRRALDEGVEVDEALSISLHAIIRISIEAYGDGMWPGLVELIPRIAAKIKAPELAS